MLVAFETARVIALKQVDHAEQIDCLALVGIHGDAALQPAFGFFQLPVGAEQRRVVIDGFERSVSLDFPTLPAKVIAEGIIVIGNNALPDRHDQLSVRMRACCIARTASAVSAGPDQMLSSGIRKP